MYLYLSEYSTSDIVRFCSSDIFRSIFGWNDVMLDQDRFSDFNRLLAFWNTFGDKDDPKLFPCRKIHLGCKFSNARRGRFGNSV